MFIIVTTLKINNLTNRPLHFIVTYLQVIGELNGKDINEVMNSGEGRLTKQA